MCVYSHTVYVYIYICSICKSMVKSEPLKVVLSLPYYNLSSLGISNFSPRKESNVGPPDHTLHLPNFTGH